MFTKQDMSVGDWIIFAILMAIPFVNIIMWIVLLASSGTNRSLKNYLIAQIVVVAVALVLFFVFGTAMLAMLETIPTA